MSMLFRQLFADLSLGAGYVEDELREISKTGDYKTFYRSRFSTFQVNPALRWRDALLKHSLSIGPSFYYYAFDKDENVIDLTVYVYQFYDGLHSARGTGSKEY